MKTKLLKGAMMAALVGSAMAGDNIGRTTPSPTADKKRKDKKKKAKASKKQNRR